MMSKCEEQAKSLVAEALTTRLENTYSDFIQNVKGFNELPIFFRNYIYSPHNKEKRDIALEKLYQKLKSITGPKMTNNIHKLIILNQLTDNLDLELARFLLADIWQGKEDLTNVKLSQEELEYAIQESNQKERRIEQVDMVCKSLTFFFSLSKLPMIRLVMAPIKVAASMVGVTDLIHTMEAGYQLTNKIKTIEKFVETFREREKKHLGKKHLEKKVNTPSE